MLFSILFLVLLNLTLFMVVLVRGYRFAVIPGAFYFGTAIYSLVVVGLLPSMNTIPFGLEEVVSRGFVYESIRIFLCSCFFYLISLACTFRCVRLMSFRDVRLLFPRFFFRTDFLFVVSMVSPVFFLLWIGPENIWLRHGYGKEYSVFGVLARLSLPLSAFAAALLSRRLLRYFSLLIIFLPVFAQTSRAMLLVGFFYLVGIFLRDSKVKISHVVFFLVYTLFTVGFTLEYRHNEVQGVYGHLVSFFELGLTIEYVILGLNYLFTYSIYVMGYMLEYVNYDPKLFWLAFNPLPSMFLDMGYIVRQAKINDYSPFSALGELAAMGQLYLYLFMILLAQLNSYIERISMRKSFVLGLIAAAFISLFTFLSTQYNLRGSVRLVYYLIFIGFIWLTVRRFRLRITP